MRILLLLVLFVLCIGQASAQNRTGAPETRPAPVEQETLRALPKAIDIPEQAKNNVSANDREVLILADIKDRRDIVSTLEQNDFEVLRTRRLNEIDLVLFVIKADQNTIPRLRNLLPDAQIDLNADLSASKGPRLYAKEKIKWPDKGACLDGALKIPIGLIDGSIDRAHPAFAGQRISEQNFLEGGRADKSHATAIASILIGNAREQGFDGLLTGAALYNAVALRHAPNGEQLASIEATLRGLDWLMSKDIRLINVSLAGAKNRVLIKGVNATLERGALIFAAAGNNGPNAKPVYPAAIDGVFAVTAIDAAGRPYKAANTGDYIDFSAPGVDIWAATPDGSGGYKSGTSYALPYALSASALQLTKTPNISKDLLSKILNHDIIAQCP
ncbi:MAG: S8 family serine peptidase [Micavibrio sp.]|nr:S8 family serine peptidase [Micavibrio sp.]